MQATHQLIRSGNVQVIKHMLEPSRKNQRPAPVAEIIVNDKLSHTFRADSRISKALVDMSAQDLAQRLTGGNFFFVDDSLVDFRDGHYAGFIQSDESIEQLIEVLGISSAEEFGKGIRSVKGNTLSSNIILGRAWSNHGIEVPGYAQGGNFNSQLVFVWNPFVKSVNTFFQLIRLICTNGMVGLTNFLNTKVPLINRWQEHLEIANRQIQNKVDSMAVTRFKQMGTERASIAEVHQICRHADSRLKAMRSDGAVFIENEAKRISNLLRIADPVDNLSSIYRADVFGDMRLCAQLPAHLTTFDTYNLATELRSHTTECPESTDFALDRFSNQILFDRENLIQGAGRFSQPTLSSFSDPETAFFGTLH